MGGTHVFIPAFEPATTMQAIQAERITSSLMVPTMVNMIIQSPDLGDVDLSSLRAVLYGASPMPSSVQKAAIEAFGPILAQGYGMTEASPLVTVLSLDAHKRGITGEEPWASRMQSAGSPVAGVRVEVRRDDGVTVCPPGEAGEIYIQGPQHHVGLLEPRTKKPLSLWSMAGTGRVTSPMPMRAATCSSSTGRRT